jgi:PAS domain S-box-containing protein
MSRVRHQSLPALASTPLASPFSELAASQAFSEPEQFVAAFLNSATIGLGIVDTDLRFQAVNHALARMNGLEPKAHLGKTVNQVLGSAARHVEPWFRRVLATEQPSENVEITALLPTRKEVGHWIENYFPIRDRAGRVKQVAATVVEVTLPQRLRDPALDLNSAPSDRRHHGLAKAGDGTQLGSTLFGAMDAATADLVWRAARPRHCGPGESFCLQGQAATNVFLLTEGLVKLCGTTRSGKEVLLDWLHPGDVFGIGGLASSFVKYLWTVRAVEPSRALSWGKAVIGQIAALAPGAYANALEIALHRTAQLQARFEELSDGFVEQRLAHMVLYLFERQPNRASSELCISDDELAAMSGTNLFSVNKTLRRWQRLGYIQKSRRRLAILDCASLRQVSLPADRARRTN